MEMKFDYVKDDPCYECRFAALKTESELITDGMFSRRFLCMNRDRIGPLELSCIQALAKHEYSKALSIVTLLINMTKRGCFRLECEDCNVGKPVCYQKRESGNEEK